MGVEADTVTLHLVMADTGRALSTRGRGGGRYCRAKSIRLVWWREVNFAVVAMPVCLPRGNKTYVRRSPRRVSPGGRAAKQAAPPALRSAACGVTMGG